MQRSLLLFEESIKSKHTLRKTNYAIQLDIPPRHIEKSPKLRLKKVCSVISYTPKAPFGKELIDTGPTRVTVMCRYVAG